MVDSVCEAEYITASDAAKKAVWLWKFIDELRIAPSVNGPILLYCDNIGAITQANEPKSHNRIKHILHHFCLVQEIMEQGDVDLQKMMKRRTWPTHLLKLPKSKNLMISGRR